MKSRFVPRLARLAIVLATVCLLPRPGGQAALTVTDQKNTSSNTTYVHLSTSSGGSGQSFTPSLATLNAADFSIALEDSSEFSAVIHLDLFAGSGYGGTLLASSTPLTITNHALQTTEFSFATPVVLTPTATYSLRVTLDSENGSAIFGYTIAASTANPYAGGTRLADGGAASSTDDLVFAEGSIVAVMPTPEPSTWAMLLGGLGLLGVALRRRARRA